MKLFSPSALIGIAIKLAVLAVLVIGARYLSGWVTEQLNPVLTPSTEPRLHRVIMVAMSIYVVLMTLPFVAGAEIGLGVMMTFGARIAPLVYISTVIALSIAFLIGRLVPEEVIIGALRKARLGRAAELLQNMLPLSTEERLEFLLRTAPNRFVPFLLRFRFLVLLVALNLPGNAVIGGGGGICMIAGFCRLFSFPAFLITVSFAVLPVPLLVFLSS